MTPPKPYKIGYPRTQFLPIEAGGKRIGDIFRSRYTGRWVASDSNGQVVGHGTLTSAKAAALVYQAWLDRTREGSKK